MMMATMAKQQRLLFSSLALLILLWVVLNSVCWIHNRNSGNNNCSGAFFFVQAAAATAALPEAALYDATWESMDSCPLPQWYNDAKIGIFILWGIFSVPAYGDAWFWKNVGRMINPHQMSIMLRQPKFDTLPIPITHIDSMLDFTNQRNGSKSLPTVEHNILSLSVSITKDFVIGIPKM
jgi:hypothetical protein